MSEHFLKLSPNHYGYYQITLCKNGIMYRKKVHRLVAEAFIPNPQNLPAVNHKDENKLNNCVENLEWITIVDNLNYGTARIRSSESRKGKPSSMKGKHHTQETKNKISSTLLKNPPRVCKVTMV